MVNNYDKFENSLGDMDIENYLNFFYNLEKKGILKEKSSIFKYSLGQLSETSNLIEKKIKLEKVIVAIDLNYNNTKLLIYDFSFNFFISFGIFIGNKSNLFEFRLRGDSNVYIASREVCNILEEKIIGNKQRVNPKDLFNVKFKFNHSDLKILAELKKFFSKNKNLNFDKIHIVDSNNIELFLPTVKRSHFNISLNLNIQLVSLFKNGFFKGTSLSFLDFKKQIKILNPLDTVLIEEVWEFDKFSNSMVYADVDKNYYVEFDKKELLKKISNFKQTNFNLEGFTNFILSHDELLISSSIDNSYLIPIWKSSLNQKFVHFENTSSFFKKTGMKFKLDYNYLNDIYIQSLKGKKGILRKKFLKSNFISFFYNLKIDSNQSLYFKTYEELIFKLLFILNTKNYTNLFFLENVDKLLVKDLIHKTRFILNYLIESVVILNKIPKYEYLTKSSFTIEDKLFSSFFNSIFLLVLNYEKNLKKNDFLNSLRKILENLVLILKYVSFNNLNLIYLKNISNVLIDIVFLFEKSSYDEFKFLYQSYFKSFNLDFKFDHSLINSSLEKVFSDIALANKLSLKSKLFYLYLNDSLDFKKYFNKNILKFSNNTKLNKILKPNILNIKSQFPYSYNLVIQKITFNNFKRDKLFILLDGKEVVLDSKFYYIYYKFEGYKQISNNFLFNLYKKL